MRLRPDIGYDDIMEEVIDRREKYRYDATARRVALFTVTRRGKTSAKTMSGQR